MSKTLQFRRYTTSNLASIIGASGELIVDTTLNQLTVHDGSTSGGWYAANAVTMQLAWNTANAAYNQSNTDLTYLASNVANLLNIDTSVNTNVALLQTYVTSANANIALLQSYVTSANANIATLFGIDTTTNTNITLLQSYVTTANANIASLYGIETTQNTNITTVTSNVANLFGIEATQNSNIQLAWNQANSTTYYTNANAVLLLAGFGSNTITTTGNVTAGNVISTGTITTTGNGIGYTTGSGGTVTQATSRTTGVTLNKPSGQITLFSQALAAGAANTFVLTNSAIAANDFLMLNHFSGGTIGNYVLAANTGAGIANVTIRSTTTVTAEAPVIQYVLIKGAAN